MSAADKVAAVVKKAGARKSVNVANLARLGPVQLATLLMELAEGNAAIKRRLKLELAGEVGAGDLAAEIAKRIEAIGQSGARVNWRKYKDFVRDLEVQRAAIAGKLTELDPSLALSMIVRFVDLAEGVLERVNDTKGEVEAVFSLAVEDARTIAAQAPLADPKALGDQLFDQLLTGHAGLVVALLRAVLPALTASGVATLRARIEAVLNTQKRMNAVLRSAVQVLADAQGDVDGYRALFTPSQVILPPIGAQIARRLLRAGRLDEAAQALALSAPDSPGRPGTGAADWEDVHIAVLEARGETDAAQAARWASFETGLSAPRLRDYLKRLADFDDVEAEDRAMALALTYPDPHAALSFFIAWPALESAALLVATRGAALHGDRADVLEPAARALEGRHPLAAILLLRLMILDVVKYARTDRYKAAQRHLLEAASLAPAVTDDIESHAAFAQRVAGFRRW
ncbi:hypothetical protein CSW58_09375 [Caulobacter sp. B11]|uniref:DUF6880 family protein n=1 Tax=Caulobacter sp. B11 TaxID=2048899 RepID=UPI000C12D8BB|nr:DUF6880 family protein [Caulobacter sp. B11]PHY12922.1 hypothetical protein CSW58_09375 [Caulobacter sp. B11]